MTTLDELGGIRGVLGRLVEGDDLTGDEAAAVVGSVLAGEVSPAQIAGVLVGLQAKGVTVAEAVGMVDAMLDAAAPVALADPDAAVDIVGTGGSPRRRQAALNVSTMACFVAAGAGVTVVKHGNRKASSTSGSVDLLEALGVAVELDGAQVARCAAEAGIAFCYARAFHPAMRHAGPVRAELGIPTVFNLLGPLSHPAGVRRQVVGVADPALTPLVSGVLAERGAPRAMVVHGHGSLDELSTTGPSQVHELRDGELRTYEVDPAALGLAVVDESAVRGGSAADNAELARRVLGGEPGPHRDIVALNAAAGIVVAGGADDLAEGLEQAQASLDEGRAQARLEALVELSSSLT